MKREQVSLWAVQVRRDAYCTVLVKTRDPEEARRIAIEHADTATWTTSEHAVAYPHQGRPTQPVWTPDGWVHPEQPMTFEGDK